MSGLSSFINRFNCVKQIPIFSNLNWLELQRIARKAILVEHKKGEVFCKEGDPPDYFYCLISGRLQVFKETKSGNKEGVDFIHRGMHFGIISVLTGENHSLNYEAINDSIVLKIPVEDFHAILKAIPQLGIELSQTLSRRLRSQVRGTKTVFESTIISIYSPVKGTGSSTYAINLALNLEKETKNKIIFVNIHSETDAQDEIYGSSVISLSEIVGDHERIVDSIVTDELPIDFIRVKFNPSDPTLKKQISPFISALVGNYHYVIVDLPNDMDDVVEETLTQSDIVHLITHDRRKDLELIRAVIDRLQLGLKENFQTERVKVIIRAAHAKVYLSFEEINNFIDFDVYTMVPFLSRSELITNKQSKSFTFVSGADHSEYTKSIRRISRQIGGVMVGLVLGGGAALGVAHVGVIRVLEQENIPIDIVVGSSMGALIAGIWTTGRKADELEVVAREFEKGINMFKLFDPPLFPISGLVRGGAIKRWLKKHIGNKTFYSTTIPLKVVAYDLTRRDEIVINSGSIVDAICKSIAIPGVIKPVQNKEQTIIDGGVLNPLPTNVLSGLGIKKIIAVNVLQSPDHVSEGYDMAQHAKKKEREIPFYKAPISYMMRRLKWGIAKPFTPNISDIIVQTLQASEYVIAEQSSQLADVLIHPDLVGIGWYELYKVDDLIKRGEEAARDLLPEIKKLVEE